jgi:predicted ATPase
MLIFNKLKIEPKISFDKIPLFMRDIAWLAPIRTEPRRTYDRYNINFKPDGTHSPYLLKRILTDTKHKAYAKRVEGILAKFGSDSGLFDNISINPLGKNDTSAFEILVSLEGNPIKITSVGYGVSQILPLIVEVISRPNESWFAIQQPEIHLHPRGQAAFGDFIYKSYQNEKKCFIIETHSDFIIDRYRLKLRDKKDKESPIDSQVLFFDRVNGVNHLCCIKINADGSYDDNQPKEFREFFIKEQLNLLKI